MPSSSGNKNFQDAVKKVKSLKVTPEPSELLNLYGYYKQGLYGDNVSPQPGFFHPKERFKWKAWENNKLMSRSKAQQEYINYVQKMIDKYGLV